MKISDSEKYIMDVLWQSSPQTAKSIIENLDPALEWQDKTVKTLINRLLKKEVIGFKKQGREYLYFPQMSESEFVEEASDSFVDRVFKGNVKSLIAAFAKPEKLSTEDIKELKELVNNLSDKSQEEK